jgi:erythromycin esterase
MSSPFWATDEIVQLIAWLRNFNVAHPHDPVRFLGTDLLQLRQASFDAVRAYVTAHAPERLAELDGHLDPIRLRGTSADQFAWYLPLPDDEQAALIDSARQGSDLVASLSNGGGLERHYAEQHARAILGWYQNFAVDNGFRGDREQFIADSITWWQDLTGHQIVYWAANAHTSSAAELSYGAPGEGEFTGAMTGGLLEAELGRRYVSIGTWFLDGEISSDFTAPGPQPIGPPDAGLLEADLVAAEADASLILFDRGAPPAVRRWIDAPSMMRMILPSYVAGDDGNDFTMDVPNLASHRRPTGPVDPSAGGQPDKERTREIKCDHARAIGQSERCRAKNSRIRRRASVADGW